LISYRLLFLSSCARRRLVATVRWTRRVVLVP
jgi:hypothetical protein